VGQVRSSSDGMFLVPLIALLEEPMTCPAFAVVHAVPLPVTVEPAADMTPVYCDRDEKVRRLPVLPIGNAISEATRAPFCSIQC
jgi:hypothetical protein